MSKRIKYYGEQVIHGWIKLEDVPLIYRKKVKEYIENKTKKENE